MALLADSRAVVKVSCEMDSEGDVAEFNSVIYDGFNVSDVLSENQWDDLEYDAKAAYKAEQEEQSTIDHDNNSTLEAIYGLSKPSFHIR
jgi:hypothetical protein